MKMMRTGKTNLTNTTIRRIKNENCPEKNFKHDFIPFKHLVELVNHKSATFV